MYPSTSSEFKSVTDTNGTNATSSTACHILQGAASGSSRQRTSTIANLTTKPGSSSVSEGATKVLNYCTNSKAF